MPPGLHGMSCWLLLVPGFNEACTRQQRWEHSIEGWIGPTTQCILLKPSPGGSQCHLGSPGSLCWAAGSKPSFLLLSSLPSTSLSGHPVHLASCCWCSALVAHATSIEYPHPCCQHMFLSYPVHSASCCLCQAPVGHAR